MGFLKLLLEALVRYNVFIFVKKERKKEIHVCIDMAGMSTITCTGGVEDVCISVVIAVI